jgi:hypothetical protein
MRVHVCAAVLISAATQLHAQLGAVAPPPPNKEPTSAPTLEQTLDWIKEKIQEQGPILIWDHPDADQGTHVTGVVEFDHSGCFITYKQQSPYRIRSSGTNGNWSHTVGINLDSLDISKIEALDGSRSPIPASVRLRTMRDVKSITEDVTKGDDSRGSQTFVALFPMRDFELAQRVAKAFQHAASLCAAPPKDAGPPKKELF